MMGPAMRRKLRTAELAKFRAKIERDPGAHTPLRVARVRAGWTMAEIAQVCDLSPSTVGSLERGATRGGRSTRRRLARCLRAPTSELFGHPV